MNKNLNLFIIILLYILTPIFCSDYSDMYYDSAEYNASCSNKDKGCSFQVSYNYPISPKIPTSIPSDATLSNYRYIYLQFNIPQKQKQKTFYLEAYDTSDGKTIISNGDCYFINTTENIDYEIRIYKKLKMFSYVQFGFLGISSNFTMRVTLRFPLSISLYFNDIALTNSNSLNKSDIPSLSGYLSRREEKINQQKKREKLAKETCTKIMENLFKSTINVTFFEDPYFSFSVVPVPPFLLVNISYSVGLDLSTENRLQSESIVLSQTAVLEGKVYLHYDGLDFLNGKDDSSKNAIKTVESYNKLVTDMISELEIEDNYYTLTISTNADVSLIIYTFSFYYEKTNEINYEIQVQIILVNSLVKDMLAEIEESYDTIDKQEKKDLLIAIAIAMGEIKLVRAKPFLADFMPLIPPLLDTDKATTISIALSTIFHDADDVLINKYGLDPARLGAEFLDMKVVNGIYHADFDCWQSKYGYNIIYDYFFDLATSMRTNREGLFTFKNKKYILWAWKGDYLNLGAGCELGFYYSVTGRDDLHWEVDKSLAMPMTLSLIHKTLGTIVDYWDNWGKDAWWITAFNPNPKFKNINADDLIASYTVKFKNEDMFNEFAKTKRTGWSYDKKNKIAFLNF